MDHLVDRVLPQLSRRLVLNPGFWPGEAHRVSASSRCKIATIRESTHACGNTAGVLDGYGPLGAKCLEVSGHLPHIWAGYHAGMSDLPVVELPPELARSVSREEVNRLPIVRYAGSIRLVSTAADLQHAAQDILQESVIGFDTETRPAFRPGEAYLPSLVQFATASAVYLLQVQHQELFDVTRDILSSPKVIKAGVSVTDDVRALQKLFAFDEQSVLDLGKIARRHGLKQTGVRNLAAIFLGARIPKGAKTTNWAARRLTPEQIAYAATDAWTCRELYVRFKELKFV